MNPRMNACFCAPLPLQQFHPSPLPRRVRGFSFPSFCSMPAPASFEQYVRPYLRPLLPHPPSTLPALVHLFRHDPSLTPHFVSHALTTVSRKIADHTGKSNAEATRLFLHTVSRAARAYFAVHWHEPHHFVAVNQQSLLDVQLQHSTLLSLTESLNTSSVTDVSLLQLQALQANSYPTVVLIYADYCSVCASVRPIFRKVAESLQNSSNFFVTLNGPKFADAKAHFQISSYPTLLCIDSNTQRYFPASGAHINFTNLTAFVRGEDFPTLLPEFVEEDHQPSNALLRKTTPRQSRPLEWQSVLKEQGIDQLDVLVVERSKVLYPTIDPLPSSETSPVACDASTGQCSEVFVPSQTTNPLCVLLGGGMGSGKTSAVKMVEQTQFWKRNSGKIIKVEADAFKMNDPLFQVLQGITPAAARIVHADSITAAEELFLKAVNERRHVLLDGTLSWCEYARQTVHMLKDDWYVWKRGRGYWEDDNGVHEEYWLKDYRRETRVLPYEVELVAVTATPETAVMRGILRRIITGRGVAVEDQLRSHALFSKCFERYVDWMDAVYLFDSCKGSDDTSVSCGSEGNGRKSEDGMDEQMIAVKSGVLFANPDEFEEEDGELVVRNVEAYREFLRKQFVNVKAHGVNELYDAVENGEQTNGR